MSYFSKGIEVIDSNFNLSHGSLNNPAQVFQSIQQSEVILAVHPSVVSEFGKSLCIDELTGFIFVGAPGSNLNLGAVYVYAPDGTYKTNLTPSDGISYGRFGNSVCAKNGVVIVGADARRTGQTYGKYYLFNYHGETTTVTTTGSSSITSVGANQGSSVALALNGTAIVGASTATNGNTAGGYVFVGYNTRSVSTSESANTNMGASLSCYGNNVVIGGPGDNSNTGKVYLSSYDFFWGKKLYTLYGNAAGDYFGYSVGINHNKIVVGAPGAYGTGNGYVKIYKSYGAQSNTAITTLSNPDALTDSNFGYSVAIGATYIAVGAPQATNGGVKTGAVYLFDLNGVFITKITPSDGIAGDMFGSAISLGPNRLVVTSANKQSKGGVYVYSYKQTYDAYICSVFGGTYTRT